MLTTSGLPVPTGFTVTEGLSASIAAGDYEDFKVQLDTVTAGPKSRQISFTPNDSHESPYDFSLAGTVTSVNWSTYLGGTGEDSAYGIAQDASGNIYITGYTRSATFAGGANNIGANNSFKGGATDAFVAKLSSSGSLLWATHLGGSGDERGNGIAIDVSGNVLVTGETFSADLTGGSNNIGANNSHIGGKDAFVSKLAANGSLLWTKYLGGGGDDFSSGIATDGNGNVLITGCTYSSDIAGMNNSLNFGFLTDAYVIKISSSGNQVWGTYLGGGEGDFGYALAVDSAGDCFMTGGTESADLPGKNNIFRGGQQYYYDAFVAKVSAAGDLLWSTFVGGNGQEEGRAIAVNSTGNAVLTGWTTSTAFVGANNNHPASYIGAFVAEVSSSGDLVWATHLGGSHREEAYGIAIDGSDNVLITGLTTSDNFQGAVNTFQGGINPDAFIAKIGSTGNLQWAMYLAGSPAYPWDQWEEGHGIVLDSAGNILVTGSTNSQDLADVNNSLHSPSPDVFVARLTLPTTLHVTINQAAGQGDPSSSSQVNFTVVFSETVTDFTGGDVILGGTAGATTTLVSGSGTTYNVAVSGMTGPGTIVAAIAAGAAHGTSATPNLASVSTDNIVDWMPPNAAAWSTFLGGAYDDTGTAVVKDASGNLYVTGRANYGGFGGGSNNAGMNNGYKGGYSDAFVAKLSPSGSLEWATYLGGSGDDYGISIAIDSSGNVYVGGQTGYGTFTGGSNGVGANNVHKGFGDNAFLAKLTAGGSLIWATLLAGEWGGYIAVDPLDNVYITGGTSASTFSGGSNNNGANNSFKGFQDGFVAKVSSSGTQLWATYLGGWNYDQGCAIVADPLGSIYVTGWTYSESFVGGSNDGGTNNYFKYGNSDAFLAKLSNEGTLLWATYIGGTGLDGGYAIAVDSSGTPYLTGGTSSTDIRGGANNWGANNTTKSAGYSDDAFVAKVSSGGSLLWATYFGGSGGDLGNGTAVDASGNLYVTGTTASSTVEGGANDAGMLNSYRGGTSDAFVAEFSASGMLVWAGYLGGTGGESGNGIVVDDSGTAFVVGQTNSSDFPKWGGSSGASNNYKGGAADAFVAVITSVTVAAEVSVTGNAVNIIDGDVVPSLTDWTDFGSVALGGTIITRVFRVSNSGSNALTTSSLTVPTGFTITEGLSASIAAGGFDDFTVCLDSTTTGSKSGQISFTTNDSDENPFNFTITGVVAANNFPTGSVDAFTRQVVSGWAYDPDTGEASAQVRVDVDGETKSTFSTDLLRADVNTAFGLTGNHGFSYTLPTLTEGSHTVSVYVLDTTSGDPTLLQSTTVVTPSRFFDEVFYLDTNPDVAAAVNGGAHPSFAGEVLSPRLLPRPTIIDKDGELYHWHVEKKP